MDRRLDQLAVVVLGLILVALILVPVWYLFFSVLLFEDGSLP